jgi:hypothetical protein
VVGFFVQRRRATSDELAHAIAAFNAMVQLWAPVESIPVEEGWWSGMPDAVADDTRFPIVLHEPPQEPDKTLLFTTAAGMTFDLRLKPGCRIGGRAFVVPQALTADDVRAPYVIESPLRARPAEPAF